MPYLLVLLVAAAAGGGVALATLRRGDISETNPQAWTKGYEEPGDVQPQEGVSATGSRASRCPRPRPCRRG